MHYRRLLALLLLFCLSFSSLAAQGVTLTEEEYQALAIYLDEAEVSAKASQEKIEKLESLLAEQKQTLAEQSITLDAQEKSCKKRELELWATRIALVLAIAGGVTIAILK